MYVIGMNGPPRSGKDSVGGMLAAMIEDRHYVQPLVIALSQPMRETVYALLGIPYDYAHYERNKDVPQELFNGRTIRQEMIDLSERHVKPRLGHDFWARRATPSIQMWEDNVTVVTDFGFESEVKYFNEEYGVKNVLTVQLEREGCNWSRDSRGYVGEDYQFLRLTNHESIHSTAYRVMEYCVYELRWRF